MDKKETLEKMKLLNSMIEDYLDSLDMEEAEKDEKKEEKK